MRCLRYLPLPASLFCLLPLTAGAEPWVEDPGFFTESAKLGSSMVDAADLNGDGWIDLVFANSEGYDKGDIGSDSPQQAFFNNAGIGMTDMSTQVFGMGASFNGRAIKARDIDRDGDNDVMLGVTWQKQSQLFINDGLGSFSPQTDPNLPAVDASIGDLELGDVDGDGDLDMILANWGSEAPVGDPAFTEGGTTFLWKQIGEPGGFDQASSGMFEDATADNMPLDKIRWSWDLEFVDVDNDFDLDIAISCFSCSKNSIWLFANNGDGEFTNVTTNNVPQGLGALDVEVIDLNEDTFLDFVTLRDGTGGRNRVLINDTNGAFVDKSDIVWPKLENPASFDHMGAFLDYNSDGRPDLVTGALQPGKPYPDRLMENQNGTFKQNTFAFTATTPGTYALILADLNNDRVLDVAMAQNENAVDKKVFLGSAELLPDTNAPIFVNYQKLAADAEFGVSHTVAVRCHDNKSPLMLHDFQLGDGKQNGRPFVESWNSEPADPDVTPPDDISPPGEWYGEYLWRVTFALPPAEQVREVFVYRICAIDAAGNKRCTPTESIMKPDDSTTTCDTTCESDTDPTTTGLTSETDTSTSNGSGVSMTGQSDTDTDTDPAPTDPGNPTDVNQSDTDTDSFTSLDSADQLDDDGCGCATTQSPTRGVLSSLALLGLLGLRRRRARA